MLSFLSLGSNISPRHHYIDSACRLIEQRVGHILLRSSDFYSAPWGYQSDHEYLNIALKISTALDPHQLLAATQLIERELGRTVKNSYQDRTIDIDLVCCFADPDNAAVGVSGVVADAEANASAGESMQPGLLQKTCGEEIFINTPDLVLPHPHAHERPFVLVPLREISAGFPLSITITTR